MAHMATPLEKTLVQLKAMGYTAEALAGDGHLSQFASVVAFHPRQRDVVLILAVRVEEESVELARVIRMAALADWLVTGRFEVWAWKEKPDLRGVELERRAVGLRDLPSESSPWERRRERLA
jgi:hypothetical protein